MGKWSVDGPCYAKCKDSVRKRDKDKCVECKMTHNEHVEKYGTRLEVHRLIPGGMSYKHTKWCVTLCCKCHDKMPRDCSDLIYRDDRFPTPKGVYGIIASIYGSKSKSLRREVVDFAKKMKSKYGDDAPFFIFGDEHPRSYYIREAEKRWKEQAAT